MIAKDSLIAQVYSAFNRRDIDGALALMGESVSWPKASEGGRVIGKAEIRAYWGRQWTEFDPHVDPLEILDKGAAGNHVRVHQLVKSLGGDVLFDGEVWQCTLAVALEFAREVPRLHFNAVEPGFNPSTDLGREANAFVRFLLRHILPLLVPFMRYWSTPRQAARVITDVVINVPGETGVYYDDRGHPMLASALVRTPGFTARVVAETRALLAQHPS